MKKLIVLLMVLMLSNILIAQKVLRLPNQNLWGSTTVTLTNTATDTSEYVDLESGLSGNARVSALFDTISGTGNKVYVDIMYRIARYFGTSGTASDTLNYKVANIDSFLLADDHKVKTWQLSYNFTQFKDPILGFKIIIRQTGTMVNRLNFAVLRYKP